MKRVLFCLLVSFSPTFGFTQAGKLDPSFGTNGIVKTSIGSVFNYNNSCSQVLTQADGSIYIILNYPSSISKRLPDGSIDSSYGIDGYSLSVPLLDVYATLQPDGKILIAGSYQSNGAFYVARLTKRGTPDSSFGVNGMQNTASFGGSAAATAVAVQTDGKVVVVGGIPVPEGSAFCVARFSKDGKPDSSFNGNGQAIIGFPYEEDDQSGLSIYSSGMPYAVGIQADGKIVVAGGALEAGANFAIARLNQSGTLDSSFNNDGKQTVAINLSDATGYSLATQPDGKILVAGQSNSDAIPVVRFNIDGSLDNSFNGNGTLTANLSADRQIRNSLAVQTDGRIVLAGYRSDGIYSDFAVVRFNANGTPDNSFNGDGQSNIDIHASDDYGGSVAIQANNKILVAGYSYMYNASNGQQLDVLRYNTNGNLDSTFNADGILEGEFTQGSTSFNDIAIQADGKIVAVGRTWNGADYDFAALRYNINGRPDSSFGINGSQVTGFGADDEAMSAGIQSDGKIIVAGITANSQLGVARYTADGKPDATFSGDGKMNSFPGIPFICQSLALQADGKIVITGYAANDIYFDSTYFATLRLNTDGTPDNTFSQDGIQLTSFEGSPSFAASVAIQGNGKIVAAGRCYLNGRNNFALVRYNTDGSLDPGFSDDGKQNNTFGDEDYFGESVAIQNDGNIVAGGFLQNFDGSKSSFAVARYKPGGSLDSAFNGSGFQSTNVGPNFNDAASLAINEDGKIALGGSNDDYVTLIYKNDGRLDSSFGINGIQVTKVGVERSEIKSLAFSADKLYAAGNANYPGDFGVLARYLVDLKGDSAVSTFITSANGNWNQPSTWIGGVVPPAAAQVIVRHNVTVAENVSCYSLKVESSTGKLIVNTGVHLVITH